MYERNEIKEINKKNEINKMDNEMSVIMCKNLFSSQI